MYESWRVVLSERMRGTASELTYLGTAETVQNESIDRMALMAPFTQLRLYLSHLGVWEDK